MLAVQDYKRSTHLYIYWDDMNRLIVFQYNRHIRARISKKTFDVLDMLSNWKTSKELLSSVKENNQKSLLRVLNQLVRFKIIYTKPVQKDDNILSGTYWNSVDLAMQRQISYGGYYPGSTTGHKPPGAIRYFKGKSTINFSPPRAHNKQGFYEVLDKRKTIRTYGRGRVSIDELSQLLYYCARVKMVFKDVVLGTMTRRPYPSGGARHPLEIYPVCNYVTGIDSGIYYYNPVKHNLVLVNRSNKYQRMFNMWVRQETAPKINREPDVTFVITAVFARTMWKYKYIGLATIMKDLGCLYQTMYLVATEMGLAPCAIGATNERLVRDWLKLNWFTESHVGCFTLGKPR